MHIFLVETVMSGHHSIYMGRIAAGFIKAGHQVTVSVLQSDVQHPSVLQLQVEYGADLNIFPINDAEYNAAFQTRLGEVGREIALRRLFGDVYQKINDKKKVDHVFLPFLDYCLYAFGLLGSPFGKTKWSAICMRPSFQYTYFGVIAPKPKLAAVKEWLFFKLLRIKTLVKLFTIDELLAQYVTEKYPAYIPCIQYLPDPAELHGDHTYESARQALDIPTHAKVVLVYGAIDERKGLDALVQAAASSDTPQHVHVLVVGKQTAWAKQFLSTSHAQILERSNRLHVIDDFVNDATQQMVFAACDVVWLGYRNHYTMSGVLVLAAISNKPSIATRDGLIGWMVKNRKLGCAINVNALNDVSFILRNDNYGICDGEFLFKKNNWINFSGLIESVVL
jgi:glycosyltransferase involved in cell wall biosynthesis